MVRIDSLLAFNRSSINVSYMHFAIHSLRRQWCCVPETPALKRSTVSLAYNLNLLNLLSDGLLIFS